MNTTLIGSKQPTLQQRSNSINLRQHILAKSGVLSDDFMYVAQFQQSPIASPPIRLDGTPWFNTLFNGTLEAGSRSIRYTFEPNSRSLAFFKLYHDPQ
jgi:hypothetical protein